MTQSQATVADRYAALARGDVPQDDAQAPGPEPSAPSGQLKPTLSLLLDLQNALVAMVLRAGAGCDCPNCRQLRSWGARLADAMDQTPKTPEPRGPETRENGPPGGPPDVQVGRRHDPEESAPPGPAGPADPPPGGTP